MRIQEMRVLEAMPVRHFEINDLADVIVIAGPNGVGKTRLLAQMMSVLRGDGNPTLTKALIEATCVEERTAWAKDVLDLTDPADLALYRTTLQANRRRRNWRSSVLQFESNRSIANVQPLQFNFDMPDPEDEEVGWDVGFGFWQNRWQDTLHSMFRLIEHQKQSIATRAIQLRRDGKEEMKLSFADPMEPFKDVFQQLLAPKTLVDPTARRQTLEFEVDGQVFDISQLSSGEREVVNIAFDFLLRKPVDSIVFFDEPELHLHPELSHRLIQTLSSIGERNQFVLSTHSPDVISASLDKSVIFVSPARTDETGQFVNQAVPVTEDDETNQALRLLGHSIGIVSLGKKIVLVEGEHSSLDKETYGSLIRGRFPGLVLVPSGGRQAIESFGHLQDSVLSKSIWGVEFYMLCDRDSMPASAPTDNSDRHFRVLKRYHLENYFLEPAVLADCFADLESPGHWLRDPSQIRTRLKAIAEDVVPYAVALGVAAEVRLEFGNLSIMPKGIDGLPHSDMLTKLKERVAAEQARFGSVLEASHVESLADARYALLRNGLDNDDDVWLTELPGKQILSRFASAAGLQPSRLKTLYLDRASKAATNPFAEIIEVFAEFDADGR